MLKQDKILKLSKVTRAKLWCVYIVRCADNTLYAGIPNKLEARIVEHNSKKGGSIQDPGSR